MARTLFGLLSAAMIAAFAVTDAQAIEIIDQTGEPGPIVASPVEVIQFTTSDIFENVSIAAVIAGTDFFDSGNGSVYLTTSIGPGTTVADEIASVSLFDVPLHTSSRPLTLLFSGLTLVPDTYYLILASDAGYPGIGWHAVMSPTTSTAPGVAIGPYAYAAAALASYAPATPTFIPSGVSVPEFRITGDLVAVPEPATLGMMAAGTLLTFAAARRNVRSRSAG